MCFRQDILQQFRKKQDLGKTNVILEGFQKGDRERLRNDGNEGGNGISGIKIYKGIMVGKYKVFGR